MNYIHMLDSISPWWWFVLALALGSLEMVTMTFFLIWPSLAALCMAGLLGLSPEMSGTMQISLFAGLSILMTFAGRGLLNKYGDGAGEADEALNKRSAYLIGRSASVLECDAGKGVVEVDGVRWRAQWAEDQISAPGQSVRITHADAMVLYVENPT